MKIEAKKLKIFLEKVSLNGMMNSIVINFSEEGLKTTLQSASVVMTNGMLSKTMFKEYESIGELGIKNTKMFTKMLDRYQNKIVELKIEENKLKIVADTGSSFFVLCDKEFTDNHLAEIPPFEFDGGVEIDTEKLVSIKKAASDVLNVKMLSIECKNKRLIFNAESDTGDKINEEFEANYHDFDKSEYGDYFCKVIECVDGKINLSTKTVIKKIEAQIDERSTYPIQIFESKEGMKIKYIVAPYQRKE